MIGSNDTLSEQQVALRFADDDAARVGELLEEAGAKVEYATTLDRDSQAVFTGVVSKTRAPTREGVLTAHKRLVDRMNRARATGADDIEYMIYYSGHGDVGPDGKGYLTLAGGDKLSRHDLFVELLGSSPADHNHIIVDACKSEEFVLSRGGDWKPDRSEVDYSRDVQQYLDRRHLGHFPNTGVVLASSADQQTHEWERFRGGIFTHELISGLRGGADINGDGNIEYSELGAFVSAANSGVSDPRARLRVSVRPPRDDERVPLLSHDDALQSKRVLLFTRGDAHRYVLEDRRGVRLADLRRSGEQPGYLRLPAGELFVYRDPAPADGAAPSGGAARQLEGRIAAQHGRVILAKDLSYTPTQRTARGALDQAFRTGLFSVPYGVGYYSGYTGRTGLLPVQQPGWEVKVFREEGGELVEVTESTNSLQAQLAAPEGPAPADQCYGDGCDEPFDEDWSDEESDWEDWVWRPERFWGALSLGVVFAPVLPEEQIRLTNDDQKIFASHTQPWAGPIRGFDIAWQTFSVHHKKYPIWVGYFRSGYTRGTANFIPREPGASPANGEATSMTYGAIPLYFGGNLFLFNNFPVRPFAGFGFGLDVLTQRYTRHERDDVEDVRARPGFELHAGLEGRITNYVSLRGEIMQLWGAKSGFDGLPNFSNTSFTVMGSIAFGFPLVGKNKRAQLEEERRRKRAEERKRRAAEQRRREATSAPADGTVRVEIQRGDERVVIESAPPPAPPAPASAAAPVAAPPAPAPAPAQPYPTPAPAPAPAPTQPPGYPAPR